MRSYRLGVPSQGSKDPTTALYALITAITYAPRGQAILDAWVAENLVPVMKVIMHIPATLPVVLPTLSHALEPMVPSPARKRKAALMGSPDDVSQSVRPSLPVPTLSSCRLLHRPFLPIRPSVHRINRLYQTNAPDFGPLSDMDAGSSPADAIAGPAPAWTIPPRSPSITPSWLTPFSTPDPTTWDAAAPSLDIGTPPWDPIPASPDDISVLQEVGPAWQHTASAFRDAPSNSQDDALAVRDVDLALREFFSAFHDVGLVLRGDSYPQDTTSYPQGDTAYPHDDTSVLDERILPMVDVTSEALNSHWAFWDGDVTEDDVMTNLTVWDAQTNSGVALTILEDEDASTLLEGGDALTTLENAASAFGGVAAISTPTYKFDAVNSIFGAANSTYGTSNSTFGTSNLTFGTSNSTFGTSSSTFGTSSLTFGTSSSTFEGTDSTSASATSTSCGDGWVGLSGTNHQDLDADVSVVSTSTWILLSQMPGILLSRLPGTHCMTMAGGATVLPS